MPHYLTHTLAFDRAAILRAAWVQARYFVELATKARRPATLRAEFAAALRQVWAIARQERSILQWQAQRVADAPVEAARRAALPERIRLIEDARTALLMAEHNDTAIGNRLVAEARTRLRSLQHAA